MEYKEVSHLLPDYIQGALPEKETRIVREALEKYSALNEEYLRMKRVMDALDQEKQRKTTPPDVANLLVGINEKLDAKPQRAPVFFRPRVLIPILAGLQAIAIVIILSTNTTAPVLPNDIAEQIEATLSTANDSQLLSLQTQIEDDILLPDAEISATNVSVESDITDDFQNEIHHQMFSDVEYEDLVQASSSYLGDDDIFAALPDDAVGEIIETVNDKILL